MNSDFMNRREMLRLCAVTGVSLLYGDSMIAEEGLIAAASAVDHLLLGAPDLDQGIQWFEDRSGVKAVVGGVHPGMGTRNALLSLGDKRYLEIIAPDPAQTTYNFQVDVRTLREPKLITWAASSTNMDALSKAASAAGYPAYGPYEGSRNKPDGTTLRWKVAFMQAGFAGNQVDPFPFFIQWTADSIHPAEDSPKGCELESLTMGHPKPDALKTALKNLGIAAQVQPAETVRLIATIRTPKGKLILS